MSALKHSVEIAGYDARQDRQFLGCGAKLGFVRQIRGQQHPDLAGLRDISTSFSLNKMKRSVELLVN